MNELGNTPADKNYKPSGISMAEERALVAYPNEHFVDHTYAEMCRGFYEEGYEQAEKDILAIIESRLSEIIGDAQPKPALRAELQELIQSLTTL